MVKAVKASEYPNYTNIEIYDFSSAEKATEFIRGYEKESYIVLNERHDKTVVASISMLHFIITFGKLRNS